ncbi:ROK family protein [Gluconacetobacter sacchari]|uniref:ROK family protein n=1 Tax=Gluconacetobacter sacchari TaxID=92759 RepID=A0A7W4NP30_9PROT|nr:ROK family protein [Gluconacetobacter sacchari]
MPTASRWPRSISASLGGHRNVFGIILGTGIGGGFVLGGRIVPGLGGVTGEWGHAPLVILPPAPHGEDAAAIAAQVPFFRCGCGLSGCLDTIAGARALERLHLWAGGSPLTSRAILQSWQSGDRQAGRTLDIWLCYMGAGLAHVINVTGSTIVPVAGGLGNVQALVDALDHAGARPHPHRHHRPPSQARRAGQGCRPARRRLPGAGYPRRGLTGRVSLPLRLPPAFSNRAGQSPSSARRGPPAPRSRNWPWSS